MQNQEQKSLQKRKPETYRDIRAEDTKPESRVVFAACRYDELLAKGAFDLHNANMYVSCQCRACSGLATEGMCWILRTIERWNSHLGCGNQAEDSNAQSKYNEHEKLEYSA
jgi:hypothetical protein